MTRIDVATPAQPHVNREDGGPNGTAKPSPSDQKLIGGPSQGPDKRVKALARFAVSITLLNILGHWILGFEQAPMTPVATALVAYTLELVLEWMEARTEGRAPAFAGGFKKLIVYLLPTHIAAMAVSMLLFANNALWPYLSAVAVAITMKRLVKAKVNGRWRHTLNPSNTGIVVVLLLFPDVGIAPPYQFTASVGEALDWIIPIGILFLGTMLNARLTGKLPLILGWAGGFIAQAAIRTLLGDTNLGAALGPMTGVAFILFTNYMITDPGSTPFKKGGQVVFGIATALTYGVLVSLDVVFGLFFSLVIACIFRTFILHIRSFQLWRSETKKPFLGVTP